MPSLRMSVLLNIGLALAFYTHASNWACMVALMSDDVFNDTKGFIQGSIYYAVLPTKACIFHNFRKYLLKHAYM